MRYLLVIIILLLLSVFYSGCKKKEKVVSTTVQIDEENTDLLFAEIYVRCTTDAKDTLPLSTFEFDISFQLSPLSTLVTPLF